MHILQFPLKLSVSEKISEDLIVAQTNLLKILETSSSEGLKSLTLLRTAYFALNLIVQTIGSRIKYLEINKKYLW